MKELNESLNKMKSLMNFQPGDLLTEQDLPIEKPEVPENNSEEEGKVYKHIDRFVREVHKNAVELEKQYKKLANATYNGSNALIAAKTLYRQKYNENMPMWRDYIKALNNE